MSTIFRTELKLLLRHWSVWVVGAASVLMATDVGHAMADLPFWLDESFLRFYLLAVLLLTIGAARRPATDRVDELIGAMPYRPAAWILGRFLANYAVWLLVTLTAWITVVLDLLLHGEGVNLATLALHWAVAAPVSVLVCTALGFALGCLPGYGLVGYILAMGYWFAAVSLPMLTDRGPAHQPWLFLDMLAPQHWMPLTVFGFFPNGWLVVFNRLFDLGAGLAVCALVLGLAARRRKLPALRAAVVLVLALAVACSGAVGTRQALAVRAGEAGDELALWAGQQAATPPAPTGVDTDRYDLHVFFLPKTHELSVTGSFDVTNVAGRPLDELELSLRANFRVSRLVGPDRQALPFTRAVDRLVVGVGLQPGETLRLTADWSGTVWQWCDSPSDYWGRALGAHVAPQSILLPANYGWYPLPVRAPLAFVSGRGAHGAWESVLNDLEVSVAPATFALQVAGTGLQVVSNAGAAPVDGLYLVGTPLPTVTSDGVQLTVAPENVSHATAALAALAARGRLLGVPDPGRVIELPSTAAYGRRWTTEQREAPGALLLRSADLAVAAGPNELLSLRWWQRVPDYGLARGLTYYMEWVVTGKTPAEAGGSPGAWVNEAMQRLDQARGRETALAVLRDLYRMPPEALVPDTFASKVEAAAGGDPGVMAALAGGRK